jgi:hypothetical protein
MAKTPIEKFIAGDTDRRSRYENKMRDEGAVKVTLWVHADVLPDVRVIASASLGPEADRVGLLASLGSITGRSTK